MEVRREIRRIEDVSQKYVEKLSREPPASGMGRKGPSQFLGRAVEPLLKCRRPGDGNRL
jgi:hypothetical protein